MKKTGAFLLVACLSLSMCACGNSEEKKSESVSETVVESSEVSSGSEVSEQSESSEVLIESSELDAEEEEEQITEENDGYIEGITVSSFVSSCREKYPDLDEGHKSRYHETAYYSAEGNMRVVLVTDGDERISKIEIDSNPNDIEDLELQTGFEKSLDIIRDVIVSDDEEIEENLGLASTFGELKDVPQYALVGVGFYIRDISVSGSVPMTVECQDYSSYPEPGAVTMEEYLDGTDLQYYAVKDVFKFNTFTVGDVSGIPFKYDVDGDELTITIQTNKTDADFSDEDDNYEKRQSGTACANLTRHIKGDMEYNAGVDVSLVKVVLISADGVEIASVTDQD